MNLPELREPHVPSVLVIKGSLDGLAEDREMQSRSRAAKVGEEGHLMMPEKRIK